MNNESEKAMWHCKPVDNPWTFNSLVKKIICAVLPNTGNSPPRVITNSVFSKQDDFKFCTKYESRIDGDYVDDYII
ncbi:hypothetical protein PQ324_003655 [Escherichia coli]|uniref:hypothetical protein n=1 Tax=Escherichia coli TaxID=562 RepID=UPI000BE474E7|nr:hypothetical protein [Escherichia coli]EFE1470678.1 hypothetical protein [Escherichia coli]EFE5706931.1 hypothetical protein [Escherichia coli]EHJ5206099.1 hypothetical protein [Escherichia coli]EHO7896745.1 hypothetical protein [Escherichia coli]EJR2151899.1 hypothetical protein [Escherichia coli]